MKLRTKVLGAVLISTLLGSVAAHAQVKQSGSVTAGHIASWTTPGLVQDGGTPANPMITGGIGIFSANQVSIGINNAVNTGQYNQLGFGVTGAGGFITLAGFGGATGLPLTITAKSLNFIVNGTTYPFPGSAGTPGGASGAVQYNNSGTFGGLTLGSGQILIGQSSGPPVATTISNCGLTSGGALTCPGGGGGTIVIGTTPITGGSSSRVLYDNAGFVGELTPTGSGNVVLSISPTLVTPVLGVPASVDLTNANNLPISGITGLGTGVGTLLGQTPSGTGGLVGKTSPSIAGLTATGSFTATGLVTNADLANPATTVNGQTCTLGSTCTVTAVASTLTIGTTTIGSGTNAFVLFNNAGVLGNESLSSLTANPTATAGPAAVNGSATTFMRSDAAPAIQLATSSVKGLVQVDGQTITANAGIISTNAPNRTTTTCGSCTILSTDMGGQVNYNGSSLTAVIPAVSSTVFAAGMSAIIFNQNATALTVSSTPALNGIATMGAGPFVALLPGNSGLACTSNGTSLDCAAIGNQTNPVTFAIGTVATGTTTIDCRNGQLQSMTNGGASTLAMAAISGTCWLRITNNGSAGAITFSGFSVSATKGEALTTTNTSKFDIQLVEVAGANPRYFVYALQ